MEKLNAFGMDPKIEGKVNILKIIIDSEEDIYIYIKVAGTPSSELVAEYFKNCQHNICKVLNDEEVTINGKIFRWEIADFNDSNEPYTVEILNESNEIVEVISLIGKDTSAMLVRQYQDKGKEAIMLDDNKIRVEGEIYHWRMMVINTEN